MLNQEYSYSAALKLLAWELECLLKKKAGVEDETALGKNLGAWEADAEKPEDFELVQAQEAQKKRAVVGTAPKSAPPRKQDDDEQRTARKSAVEAAAALTAKEPQLIHLEGARFDSYARKRTDVPGGFKEDPVWPEGGQRDGFVEPPGDAREKGRDWRDDISALEKGVLPASSHRWPSRGRSRSARRSEKAARKKKDESEKDPGGGKTRSLSPGRGGKQKKKKKDEGSSSGDEPPDRVRGSLVVPPKKKKKKKKKKGSSDPSSSSSSGAGKRKKKSKKDKDGEKKRRKKKRSSSSSRETSDSDEDFYGRESRKFASLLEKAQKQPGKLLRSGLEQMGRYMASRVGDGQGGGASWREQKVTAYLSQVLFTQCPPQAMGVRNSRELLTLAEAIDQLMAENFASVGDILMQRFKATESSLADGWMVARHQELIRPEHASLTSPQEKAFAARAALQQHRLETAVKKRHSG